MRSLHALALLITLAMIVLGGTVFFHLVEGWNWIDSYFFTVVTLSTVGYGSLVPATTLGKIGTTIFIFVGLGVFAVAIQKFGSFTVKRREQHTEWLIARLGHHKAPDSEEPDPANESETPSR